MSRSYQQVPRPPIEQSMAGHWRVIARPFRAPAIDLTNFRGEPVEIGKYSFEDPFGPKEMTINFPQISPLERLGSGDTYWLKHPNVDIDVIWADPLPAGFVVAPRVPGDTRIPGWRWEGYHVTTSRSSGGVSLQLKGSMFQLDNWQAKPENPQRPLPYEWAIARQFYNKASLRMLPLKLVWPSWWTRTYVPVAGARSYLIPSGVQEGQYWTGLVTRSTGSWEPTLTSYIQGLLASMYTERGRWTLELDAFRQPVMFHRDLATGPGPKVAVFDPIDPGVLINLREDWDQTLTTVYGAVTGLNGVTYSGMNISPDGSETRFTPLAALRQVWPQRNDNGWLDQAVMEREVSLQMQPGLEVDDAQVVARSHLLRFSEPGHVGTLSVKTDPVLDGVVIPKGLVRAGMDIQIPGYAGQANGIIAHVSASAYDPRTEVLELTVDTKARDQLTVEEVRLRGRDSLSISRMLLAGQYTPPVPDMMLPWSYAEGSGTIPSNAIYNAMPLFNTMPSSVGFPWTEWTTTHPPKDAKYRSCYLRLGPAQNDASANWITQHSNWGSDVGVPIKMAQAGQIRQLLVAAYDADGNVMKVPFHISFYYVGSVNVQSMPQIPASDAAMYAPYAGAQRYPYVRDGFESVKEDGTKVDPNVPQPIESVGLIRAYGTFYEKAGFFPGAYSTGDPPTGMLVDEQPWSFDITGISDSTWDPYRAERNYTNPLAGSIYAMIYCDGQGSNEVFFLGKMYRVEPGQGG